MVDCPVIPEPLIVQVVSNSFELCPKNDIESVGDMLEAPAVQVSIWVDTW